MLRPAIKWMRRYAGLPCLMWVICLASARDRGLPATEGIGNFGQVDEHLYRGAQPDVAGLESLQRLGVRTIINLRQTNDVWRAEEAEAQAKGILYTNLPLSGVGRPTTEQVETILALIQRLPSPVFVHCQHGCDRTGTIVACYRIRQGRWTAQAAQAEANRYGMSSLVRGMRRFVAEFTEATRPAR